jgi:hypothetical protein
MVKHINHDDVFCRGGGEGKTLGIGDAIEPTRWLDIGGDYFREPLLKIAHASADFDRHAGSAFGCQTIIEITVNGSQNRLAIPYQSLSRQFRTRACLD